MKKNKNVNIKWNMVGGQVFESLKEAKRYCDKKGYDYCVIKSGDEIKDAVMKQSKNYYDFLSDIILPIIDKEIDKAKNDISSYRAMLEKCEPLDKAYISGQINERSHQLQAYYDVWLAIDKIRLKMIILMHI